MLTLTPIVNTLTALPISLSGVGVRESTFQILLSDLCGVPAGAAVLIDSLGFVIRAAWAVLGCFVLACCRRLQWEEWIARLVGQKGGSDRKSRSEPVLAEVPEVGVASEIGVRFGR